MAISTWSYAQCTGMGGTAVNTGGALCPGDMTSIVLAGASAPSMGDVSGYSWVISNADISGSTDPLNSATYVAGLPVTADPAVQLMEVLSNYVSDAGTYYLTSVAFGNGTWTGADMDDIGDVTLDPNCTFTGTSAAVEFGGAACPPSNNECAGAIDLSSSLGQGTSMVVSTGPYDNTMATTEASDPTDGFSCFGEPDGGGANPTLENTLWFKVTGDGGLYFVEATTAGCSVGTGIDDNDTQIAVYTGTCGMLTPFACNEDGSNASNGNYPSALDVQTEAGVEYFIMVDGFNFNGTFSDGEFCVQITEKAAVPCTDPNLTGGTASAADNIICQGELTSIEVTGALAPTEGTVNGYGWAISTGDLQGNPDFANDPTFIGGFAVSAEPVSPLVFDHSSFAGTSATGNYFYTLVAFGNGTWAAGTNETFLSEVVTDPNCTYLSNSFEVEYYETAFCPDSMVSVLDVDKEILGMTVFPNPVKDVINLNINSNDYITATILVSTVTGQAVREEQIRLVRGFNNFTMDMSDAATGVYMVSIASDTHQSVTRFLKQ